MQKELSLAQRCHRFSLRFAPITISPSYLRFLYRSRGISHKATYSTYALTPQKEHDVHMKRLEQFKLYLQMEADGKVFFYMDECIFKPHKVQQRSWAHKYQN